MALVRDAAPPAPTGAPDGRTAATRRSVPGVGLAVASVFCVQLGAAASTSLFAAVGPAGAAWLRLSWAAVIFVLVTRPRAWAMARRDLVAAVLLGVVSAGTTLLFFEAIARIPLATAVACELMGPLAVAVARRAGRLGLAWPALAGAGVLLVTQPWRSSADLVGIGCALAAAICWAGYILLTQRVGDRLTGLTGLAISMPAAALVAGAVAAPQALPRVNRRGRGSRGRAGAAAAGAAVRAGTDRTTPARVRGVRDPDECRTRGRAAGRCRRARAGSTSDSGPRRAVGNRRSTAAARTGRRPSAPPTQTPT